MIGILGFFTGGIGRWIVLTVIVLAALAWEREHLINIGRQQVLTENQDAALKIITKQGAVTERVVTQYVKVAGKTQVVTETVEKEIVKYAETNSGLCLDAQWRSLHDSAANNAVSPAPKPANDRLRATGHASGGDNPSNSGAGIADRYLKLRAASSLRGQT